MVINAECGKTVRIAYQGENKRQQVRFDLADIMGEFPGGTAVLAILRSGDTDPVPAAEVELDTDGKALIWTVTAWECAVEGFVYAQVTYAVDNVVAKTKIWRFDVKNSLVVSAAEPETWQDLVGQLVTAAAGVNTAIAAAQEQLRQYVADAEAAESAAAQSATAAGTAQAAAETAQRAAEEAVGQYDDMTATATGLAAGEEPTAEIDHTGSAPVLRLGIPAGDPGTPGHSPVLTSSKSGKVTTIYSDGQQLAQISDGEDGQSADVIDDTAGAGDTDKTFSANKLTEDHSALLSAINVLKPAATASDVGKALVVKTVADGVPTEFEYVESGGGGGGAVDDVQINGTSIVQDGVANIPIAAGSRFGVVRFYSGYGIDGNFNGLYVTNATSAQIKSGSDTRSPINPYRQHEAAFYGLATAAGDTTQKASSNAVGTYTESAKSAISEMLNGAVSVSGTTPSITAKAGVRYICGEVSTLTIVVPASGCIDVTFTSGSTPTVLTVTPPSGMTMRWANGFDPTALEANTTYEINIMDGCLGVSGSWT